MRALPRPAPPTQDVHQAPPAPRPTPAPPTPPPGIPYIGARISLISNMNIRYEGTLYTIDPKEATVALQSVRCFGTEGRVPPSEEVAPSPHSYQFIIFRGKDIKDLHVCETPVNRFLPSQPPPPHDPAIVATGTVSSPFGTPMGLGSFNKPDLKQAELEQKAAEERFRLASTTEPLGGEATSESSKDKGVTWTSPATTAGSQTAGARNTEAEPKSTGLPKTPPKPATTPVVTTPPKPTAQVPPTATPVSGSQPQGQAQKKKSPVQTTEQSKNQYKPKPQSYQSNQGYQKGPSKGQKGQDGRKPREPSKGTSGFYPAVQKKGDKKKSRQKRVEEDPSRTQGSGSGSVNYDGPGTGSYLERRVGNPTISPAIPQGEFDIQSSNARFDKDRFKEQVLKVATQKAKTGSRETESTPPETRPTTTVEGESAELTDLLKKLKSGSEKSSSSTSSNQSSSLSPSAVPFVPAAEGKKELKAGEKEDKENVIDGVQVPDNLPTAPKYEKKNFFDDISTDRDVSQRRDMVKKDTETFGDIAANYGYYNRQRPRYFNSGGNYRGRRGGRGGGGSNTGTGYGGGVLNGGSGAGAYYRAVQRI